MSEQNVKGLAELQSFLDQLTPKMERNVMRGALRAGMGKVKPVAQRNIHSISGELAKGLKVSTDGRGGKVWASLKATGPHAYVAKWVEYGTATHFIKGRFGKVLSFLGVTVASVEHPGARPHPFMRPALHGQAGVALVATGEYIKRRLANKHGLDTAGIDVEVEA